VNVGLGVSLKQAQLAIDFCTHIRSSTASHRDRFFIKEVAILQYFQGPFCFRAIFRRHTVCDLDNAALYEEHFIFHRSSKNDVVHRHKQFQLQCNDQLLNYSWSAVLENGHFDNEGPSEI
jgi:hypothetical protein